MPRVKNPATVVALMDQAGVNVRELGDVAQCSPGFISHLRTGRRPSCTPELASRIAECLGVAVDVIFDVPAPASSNTDGNQPFAAA